MQRIVVPGKSRREVNSCALRALQLLATESLLQPIPPDMMKVLEFKLPQKVGVNFGVESLPFGIEARIDPTENIIILSPETYEALCDQNHVEHARARFTVAHEIGHIMMHRRYLKEIHDGIRQKTVLNRGNIPAYADPEWQANKFAAEFLMPADQVKDLILTGKTVGEIANVFQVSYTAASIKFDTVYKQFGLAAPTASPNFFF